MRVTFNTNDDIEQRIDRLTMMMGKLITEDRVNHLNHKCINLTEVGIRIEVIIEVGLG